MSIIEKLGITPGPWEVSEDYKDTIFKPYQIDEDGGVDFAMIAECCKGHGKIISAAPEMLEALIDFENGKRVDFIPIIQKATGKTWEEIKELINEED